MQIPSPVDRQKLNPGRVLGDTILFLLSVGFILFLLYFNGFIGQSDVQPYPY